MSNPGNPEGVVLHPAFMTRYAALAGSFQSRPQPVEEVEAAQKKVTDTFTSSSSWNEKQERACQEKCAALLEDQYLPFTMVESQTFRDMVSTLNSKASIPSRSSIKRTMEEMRVHIDAQMEGLMRDEWVCHTTDSWTARSGQTFLGVTYHWIGTDWVLRSM